MTFAKLNDTSFDAALDIIAPRASERDVAEDSAIAVAYAAGITLPLVD